MANEWMFQNRAQSYVKGRPGYAPEIRDLLLHDILRPNDLVADVGSGTGIFSKIFMDAGFDVFCVEPNEAMRKQAERIHAGNPHFISVAASAEATTLPSHHVHLVTAASAFHWFDADSFYTECQRILKPGGIFFTVVNARDYDDPFTCRQHALCTTHCNGFTSLKHGLLKSEPALQRLFGSRLNHRAFRFPLTYQKEAFVQRSLSSSYAPEPNTVQQQKYSEQLWRLMEEFAPGSDAIVVPNLSLAYWAPLP